MTGDYLLDKLLDPFRHSYDVERTCDINGDIYDAYASYNATGSKYVLIRKAELWRAECFEHIFLRKKDRLTIEDIERFHDQVVTYIEPELVRGGKRWPGKDHMYTYMTAIYICEDGVSEEVKKKIKRYRYVKNYKLTIRGYSEVRILVFDLKNEEIFGNKAAHDLVKGYTRAGIF